MSAPVLMQQNRVPVADIIEQNRLRPVSESGVQSLMASIEETGVMKDAIHIRKKKDGQLWLIAGGHRLEAARRLGWAEIEAKVWTDVTDDWARLMEIDDNLAGAEMNALDTAVFLATRKKVYEKIHPETTAAAFKGNQYTGKVAADIMSVATFAAATAEKFGLSERHVRRMIAAGEALTNPLSSLNVDHLRRAPEAVKLADLMVIAKADGEQRMQIVRSLITGEAKSAAKALASLKPASAAPVKDPDEEAFKALLTAWKRAPKAAKRRFADATGVELLELLGLQLGVEMPARGIAAE